MRQVSSGEGKEPREIQFTGKKQALVLRVRHIRNFYSVMQESPRGNRYHGENLLLKGYD